MKRLIFIFIVFHCSVYSQIPYFEKFSQTDNDKTYETSSAIDLGSGNLLLFFNEGKKLFISSSFNYGINWEEKRVIFQAPDNTVLPVEIHSLLLSSGRIIVIFKYEYTYCLSSNDSGNTWSNGERILTGTSFINSRTAKQFSFTYKDSNIVYLNYVRSTSSYRIESSDEGEIWGTEKILSATSKYPSIVCFDSNKEYLFYLRTSGELNKIFYKKSSNNGITWDDSVVVIETPNPITELKVVKNNNNKIYVVFSYPQLTSFNGLNNDEIVYITSENEGQTWTNPINISLFKGYDGKISLQKGEIYPLITFSSERFSSEDKKKRKIFYGYVGSSFDKYTPPYLFKVETELIEQQNNFSVRIKAFVDDYEAISSVKLDYIVNNQLPGLLDLYDDGNHYDSLANDKIFGNEIVNLKRGEYIVFKIKAKDISNNEGVYWGGIVTVPLIINDTDYVLYANSFKLPINNKGVIADIGGYSAGGYISDFSILYSAGFLLSGYSNNILWANGSATSLRILDYVPGKTSSISADPKNVIYVVNSSDSAFGSSWQNWKAAVEQGAYFYDGNGDNIYNPIDLNGNGQWDENEDKPEILGDITAFCVYNDGKESSSRRFTDVTPQGIEIHQTAFAYKTMQDSNLTETVFFRYKLINTGLVSDKFDSVYFSFFADPDLCDYTDDLIGCDTIIQSGYGYHKETDNNCFVSPSFFSVLLQGPQSYEPGVTFVDVNNNNIYDPEIDIPLDTAYMRRRELGVTILPGATNKKMSSFMQIIQGDFQLGSPISKIEARKLMTGKDRRGYFIDPCTWENGNVYLENCYDVNPSFMYSGDPIQQTGWINLEKDDQLYLLTTGPFILKYNEPVELIFALLGGVNYNASSSFLKGKETATNLFQIYSSNFDVPLGLKYSNNFTLDSYKLYQNYPNPFNPSTTIMYQIPQNGIVTLKVYDILGREVTTLVNEEKIAGKYSVIFNGSQYSSGVYFYEIRCGNYKETKKFMILK